MNTDHQDVRARFIVHTMWNELEKIAVRVKAIHTPASISAAVRRLRGQQAEAASEIGLRRFVPFSKERAAYKGLKSRHGKAIGKYQRELQAREQDLLRAVKGGKNTSDNLRELREIRKARQESSWFHRPAEGATRPRKGDVQRKMQGETPTRYAGKTPVTKAPKEKPKKGVFRRAVSMAMKDPAAALGVGAAGTAGALATGIAGKKYLESRQQQDYGQYYG